MTPDPASLLPIALEAASIATGMMQAQHPVSISEKHDRDLVSDVDVAIERAVRAFLHDATPSVGFLGEEEGGSDSPESGWLWTLDPIDGTSNFAHGLPLCATSLALVHDGRPVLGVIDAPFLGQRYHAVEGLGAHAGKTRLSVSTATRLRDAVVAIGDYATGPSADRKNEARLAMTVQLASQAHRIRMLGTAALDLAWVADGRLDASIIVGSHPWDTAAGVLIAREAGATVVDTNGRPHDFRSSAAITAPAALIDQLLALIEETGTNTSEEQGATNDRVSPYAALDGILSKARYLIFDFDGPTCDLSAAMPPDAPERLRRQIRAEAVDPSLADALAETHDVWGILTRAAAVNPDMAAHLDAELTAIEVTASANATPAAYAHEVVAACRDSGRTPAVISRHSSHAVSSYLARYGLTDQFAHVIAPGSYPPGHLQTMPHLLGEAIRTLQAAATECALITAYVASAEAARHAGAHPIGYATTRETYELLADAGVECILPSLADLTLRLRARPLPN
jgi:myo-inositol-1(or 4)-monophosphatase